MTIITDSTDTEKYLQQVLEAFDEPPVYTLKVVNFRATTTKETLRRAAKKSEDKVVIFISSLALNIYYGVRPHQWDIQPDKAGDTTLYVVPTLGWVIRRNNDLNKFAKVISAAQVFEGTGGVGYEFAEEIPVTDLKTFKKAIREVLDTGVVCFDFETYTEGDSKDYEWFRPDFHASLLSISPRPGVGYTIPLDHYENPMFPEDVEKIKKGLNKWIFNNPDIRKIGWNVKFDMHVAKKIGMKLAGPYHDPMIMLSLVDNTRKSYQLKVVAGEVFPTTIGYEAEVGGYQWKEVPLDILGRYAANDTSITMQLAAWIEAQMEDRLRVLYRNLVAPATKVLQKMEYTGMYIDERVLDKGIAYADELEAKLDAEMRAVPEVVRFEEIERQNTIDKIINQEKAKIAKWQASDRATTHYEERSKQKIRDIKTGVIQVYDEINFGSYKQLKSLLYDSHGFGFNSLEKTTNETVIKQLPDKSGFIDKLLLLRKINKAKGTYLEGIKKRLVDGKLHTTFTQHVTNTGRLSSRDPNLQNLPNIYRIQDPEIAELVNYVKASFVPPKDHLIMQFDLSQAELRFMAEFSQDETMVTAYKEGKDLHAVAAAANLNISLEEFYKLSEDEIKDHRFRAKARNFGLIYLMSPQGYREYAKNNYGIELTDKEAFKEHEMFFALYPGIRRYHKIYEAKAKKHGKVRNWFGRQRLFENIHSEDGYLQSMDIRAAINTPIQGTCGDYTTMCLVMLDLRLGSDIILVNSIHDSVLPYIHKSKLKRCAPIIMDTLNNLPVQDYFGKRWKTLQMKSDMEGSEKSWADMKEIIL